MYTLTINGLIIRDADQTAIPIDPDNDDYQAYMAWQASGNVAAPPDIELVRASKTAQLNDAYTVLTAQLSAGYPSNEQKSWPVQIMESAAILAGSDVDTPWVDSAAAARGITRDELAVKIRDMDVIYRLVSGQFSGVRQALIERVNEAQTIADISAIEWPTQPA